MNKNKYTKIHKDIIMFAKLSLGQLIFNLQARFPKIVSKKSISKFVVKSIIILMNQFFQCGNMLITGKFKSKLNYKFKFKMDIQ